MGAVIGENKILQLRFVQCRNKTVDRTIPDPLDALRLPGDQDLCGAQHLPATSSMMIQIVVENLHLRRNVGKFFQENLPDFFSRKLLTSLIGQIVNSLSNLRMHRLGEIEAVLLIKDVGDASLSTL